ncbi:sigma-70 family RNA polymerase sigma factor [Rufibacter sediminis]|uniref:Sigma-70 family RNA polymerase sigma factor n=1 Tax=Rufibacter sediminis TaxID=2762756 RepID=A0ABR6VPS6_9BACT|nr:sigma-70 family RNA polymerase sigma factor [Rufibacter sediminis]MBC3539188.1 sigma-70 family RNA polymerase sigma factor [Rufibacter sediminis]
MYEDQPDVAVWEAIQQDDVKAFNALFERYWSRVFTTAFSHLKDREVCEEIVHSIFLNIWTKRHQLQIGSFQQYLTAAARYHVYKHLKSAKVIPLRYTDQVEQFDRQAQGNQEEEEMRAQELELQLDTHLEKLPRRCQEIFYLSRKMLLPNEDIASQLGISKRSVENQITVAQRHLRLFLKNTALLILFLV